MGAMKPRQETKRSISIEDSEVGVRSDIEGQNDK
jgi:hypothetical protein